MGEKSLKISNFDSESHLKQLNLEYKNWLSIF
jgi:hypothetical protein